MIKDNTDLRKEYELYLLSCLGMDIDELIDTRCMTFEDFVEEQGQMTPKEAIEILMSDEKLAEIEYYGGFEGQKKVAKLYSEAFDMAIEALGKQIPKKPLNQSEEYDRTYGNCPCCGEMVVDYPDDFRVCSNCGQVIDWGEEE